MVGRSRHSADTIVACGKTASDCSLQSTVAITSVINTFEEDESGGIWCCLRRQVVTECLDSDVNVANDVVVVRVQGLGSGIVSDVWIGENACVQVRNLELDIEILVGGKVVARSRVCDDG